MTLVGTKEILGGSYEVHTSARDGEFRIIEPAVEEGGRSATLGSAQTLAGAVAKARAELKKRDVKVSVPFRLADGRKGTATGFHARNNTILVVYEDGSKDALSYGGREAFKPDMPEDKVQRLAEIVEQERTLATEKRAIETAYKMDMGLGWHVKQAIERAAAEQAGVTV